MADHRNTPDRDLIAKIEAFAQIQTTGSAQAALLELTARFETLLNQYDTDCAGARSDGFLQGRADAEAEFAKDKIEMAALTSGLLIQVQQNTMELVTASLERIDHAAAKEKAYMDGYSSGLKDAQGPTSYADKI
jgi:hypothetical protein